MAELELDDLLKIYPFTKPGGLLGRKKAQEALEREKQSPYTTNEGVIALQKFSLHIADGEFAVLLGPSGCGKSTLLRLIAGLDSPINGQIRMDGKVINALPPEQRDIAMVFQNYNLFANKTALGNVMEGLPQARGVSKEKAK